VREEKIDILAKLKRLFITQPPKPDSKRKPCNCVVHTYNLQRENRFYSVCKRAAHATRLHEVTEKISKEKMGSLIDN
jgi:hypothetical protein